MNEDREGYGPLAQAIFAVPVLGWMLRGFAEGDTQSMAWFAVSLIGMIALSALTFGLPGLVIAMLGMAVFALTMILVVTRG